MPTQPATIQMTAERNLGEQGMIFGVKELFKKSGLEFTESDIPKLKVHKPDRPPFPILILSLALTKDAFDIALLLTDAATITGIGAILMAFGRAFAMGTMFIVGLILFLWIMNKINRMMRSGLAVTKFFIRSYVKKRIAQGAVFTGIEIILPYLPFATIFVLLAHYDENKYVKIVLAAAEHLGKAKASRKS